ncbi:unnamed protein product [Paramecium sonneborni]|uniref:Uncharacterized protein n=1 Tax=Paramecium sonneborni TaxID=65129 RepID=A0A8S1QAR7_9CILI|nr:unnamed protein product [Paramecium sonneborni]
MNLNEALLCNRSTLKYTNQIKKLTINLECFSTVETLLLVVMISLFAFMIYFFRQKIERSSTITQITFNLKQLTCRNQVIYQYPLVSQSINFKQKGL